MRTQITQYQWLCSPGVKVGPDKFLQPNKPINQSKGGIFSLELHHRGPVDSIIIYYSCNSIQEVLRLRLNIKESFWEYFEYSILTFTHFMFYDFMENKLCWFWNWVYKNTQNKSSLRTETLHSKYYHKCKCKLRAQFIQP